MSFLCECCVIQLHRSTFFFTSGMESVYSNKSLRQKMAVKARVRFERTFELDLMVESYRQLMINVAPPVILLDMDGVLVDWDKGFMQVK